MKVYEGAVLTVDAHDTVARYRAPFTRSAKA